VLTQGQFAFVNAPNADSSGTYVSGVSNSGVIVGTYVSTLDAKDHAFSGPQFADIVFPSTNAKLNTFGTGINTAGQIVGYYQSNLCPSLQDCYSLHGFLLTAGSFAKIDFPGAVQTVADGINDAGQIVGSSGSHGFLFSAGSFSTIDFPGSASTVAAGINNGGVVTGYWFDSSNRKHGFVLAKGTFTSLDFPGAISTTANGINDASDIVGSYTDANGQAHGFMTDPISLVDPVPDLLNGSSVMTPNAQTGAQLLATKGTVVQGVAADGVAEVVIRIMAKNVGDQFALTLVNDQNSQIIPGEDGALGNPGDTSFSLSQISVTAVNTGTGPNGPNPPFAFAIYRAPVDFARQVSTGLYKSGACGPVTGSDDQLACRSVSLKVQNSSGSLRTVPISILRPPVILIHGLWGSPSDWNSFSPLFSNIGSSDSRFHVGVVDYDQPPIVTIVASTPDYSSLPSPLGLKILADAHANSLGFQYNAVGVLAQIDELIGYFKSGQNPTSVAAAAVQGDIVAHSMGGEIIRTLPLEPLQATFLGDRHLGQGNVHKTITIDSPHRGSPLATDLLMSQNNCVRNILASGGRPSFQSVQVVTSLGPATPPVQGGVGDLVDSPTSQALLNIASPGSHPLPTALIAGTLNSTNLAGLADTSSIGFGLHSVCGTVASNPLAVNLTPASWTTVFGEANDAIVGLSSQLNNLSADPGQLFTNDGSGRGFVHSAGTERLGFLGPSVLDPSAVPNQVINLLNTPISSQVFHLLNP
jgi:pimeloyl-ACP methyl ester carboxylesterase